MIAIDHRSRVGFSLIEMLAVLAIVSMVTISVTVRWSTVYRDVQWKSDIARLIDFEFKARQHAADRHRFGELVFDLENQTIHATRWVGLSPKKIPIKLSKASVIESISDVDSKASQGQVLIPLSNVGSTPTYGVSIRQGNKHCWILFAGRTGQTQEFDDEEQVNQVLDAIRVATN